MHFSFSFRRYIQRLGSLLAEQRGRRLRSRRHGLRYPIAAHIDVMELRELLSSIVVTSTSGGQNYASNVTFSQLDPGHTAVTLRDAVNAANNTSGADTISFDVGVFPPNTSTPTTIVLSGGMPVQFTDTTGATSIAAPGASQVAVSGNNQSTVFLINVGVTVAIDGLTITSGKGSIDIGSGLKAGGGLYNNGRLTLQNIVLTANAAGNSGGGFYNNTTGTVSVLNSTITGNSGVFGGGFFNAGSATVTSSTIADNSVTTNGGGFYNLATVTVTGSTLARNSAGGNGGGFFSNNTANVINSTLTGNSAGSNGGGFINLKTVNVVDSTIARNFATQGAGIFNSVGTVTLSGTILAQNSVSLSNATPHDWGGLSASAASSYNLVGDGAGTGLANGANHNLVGTSVSLVNPRLAALGDYGGPVQTMALLPGSAALAAGSSFMNPANGQAIVTDERGVPRVLGTSDIGAYQSAGFALLELGGDNQSAIIDQVFASPLVVQLIEKAFGKALPGAGVIVNFAAPVNSAGASFSAGSIATDANGQVSVTAQANGTIGGPYDVVASAAGVDAVAFALTNLRIPSQIPGTPTVVSQTTTNFTPTLTGTWDAKNSVVLQVTISNAGGAYSATYTLGADAQLSTSGSTWSLDLSSTTPLAVGSFSVVVHTANDVGQVSDSAAGSLIISSTPPIVGTLNSPAASIGVPVSITTQILGGDLTGLTATIDWGDGTTTAGTIASVNGVLTTTGSHAYSSAGTFNIVLSVTNASGLSGSATSTAAIASVSPVLGDLNSPSASIGVPVSITAQILGGDLTGLTATIDWGDGTTTAGTIANVNGVLTATGSHTYSSAGSFGIVLSAKNASGLSASVTSTAVIASVSPVLGTLNSPVASVGATVSVTTQVLGGDTTGLTATIDWGDGTTTAGTIASVNGVLTATGSHAYSAAGSFGIVLSVTNASGLTATAASKASITSVSSGADLQVIRGPNIQIVAMNASASYDFDVQFVSGGVKLIGANGTTFDGVSTLFVSNARSISGQLASGDDRVRISGTGKNVNLEMGAGQNDVTVQNFEGQKLQVSSEGGLGFHAWNSQMSSLFVSGSTSVADFVHLSGVRVGSDTLLKLGGGENRVQIDDSTFDDFKLQSRGIGTVIAIETGRADGTRTRFNGTAVFVVGGDSEITVSPVSTSDQTRFGGRLIIYASSPDATWTRTNVTLASRPLLYNVEVVGPRLPVTHRTCR